MLGLGQTQESLNEATRELCSALEMLIDRGIIILTPATPPRLCRVVANNLDALLKQVLAESERLALALHNDDSKAVTEPLSF